MDCCLVIDLSYKGTDTHKGTDTDKEIMTV